MLPHRLLLAGRATAEFELFQEPTNGPTTGGRAHRDQPPRQLAQRQVRPKDTLAHGVARREFGEDLA
jgi:hypothetical protein